MGEEERAEYYESLLPSLEVDVRPKEAEGLYSTQRGGEYTEEVEVGGWKLWTTGEGKEDLELYGEIWDIFGIVLDFFRIRIFGMLNLACFIETLQIQQKWAPGIFFYFWIFSGCFRKVCLIILNVDEQAHVRTHRKGRMTFF
jgi:hypothetical protein